MFFVAPPSAFGSTPQSVFSPLHSGHASASGFELYLASSLPNVAFGRPILVNDMFEHAYHMDYGANAAMYIDAFMQNINWDECNRRLEEAKKMYASLK